MSARSLLIPDPVYRRLCRFGCANISTGEAPGRFRCMTGLRSGGARRTRRPFTRERNRTPRVRRRRQTRVYAFVTASLKSSRQDQESKSPRPQVGVSCTMLYEVLGLLRRPGLRFLPAGRLLERVETLTLHLFRCAGALSKRRFFVQLHRHVADNAEDFVNFKHPHSEIQQVQGGA